MGSKRKHRERELSLEEQLRELDANEVPGDPVRMRDVAGRTGPLIQPSPERVAWVRKRADIVARLRKREGKRLADPGKDASGNFSPSPYAVVGHVIGVAPKDLGTELPKDGSFPKRIETQRMIDRYRAQGLLTARQWKSADRLWRIWRDSGRDPNLIGNYSPDAIRGTTDPDAKMIGRTEAIADWEDCRRLCGVLGFGLVVDVVIWDHSAADWAARKGHSTRDQATIGMALLRGTLDTLTAHFRY